MDTSSVSKIGNLGSYVVVLSACFDHETDLQVPLQMLNTYEENKKKFQLLKLLKLSPPIQALILEERRLRDQLQNFPPNWTVADQSFLRDRHAAVSCVRMLLIREALAMQNIRIENGSVDFYIDAEWHMHVKKP